MGKSFTSDGPWKDKDLTCQQIFVDKESGQNDLCVIGYGDFCLTEIVDFDNPSASNDVFKYLVWNDFAHKLWMIFYENIFFPRFYGKTIYSEYFDRYARQWTYYGYKKSVTIKRKVGYWASDIEELTEYIANHINKQLDCTPFTIRVTPEAIRNMFGGVVFPLIQADLVKMGYSGDVYLFYSIFR